MKASKKLSKRVLTGAIALSMLTGTGICASAAEPADDTDLLVMSESNDTSAIQIWLSKLLNGLPKEIIRKIAFELSSQCVGTLTGCPGIVAGIDLHAVTFHSIAAAIGFVAQYR